MAVIPFEKMHGAGNDFAVIDNRKAAFKLDSSVAKQIADRRFGVGCDQCVVMESSDNADVFMRLYNSDGSEAEACGNATRCIGWHIMQENGSDAATIETLAGVLECKRYDDVMVTVDMGEPKFDWQEIPLSEPRNTEHLGIAEGMLMDPVAVNMGNPHMVFFIKDMDFIPLNELGPKLENHVLFPERTNVTAARVIERDRVQMQVWERGAGLTLACGTAACATLVAGVRRGLLEQKATMSLPGGELIIEWNKDNNHIYKTGPIARVFSGELNLE